MKYIFYMDDFGTRTSCKNPLSADAPAHELSFALGGIIVRSEHVNDISGRVTALCDKWDIPALHGHKIRTRKGKFAFMKDTQKSARFFSDLEEITLDSRLVGHACVVCRPGYRTRYHDRFPEGTRWDLSRTAFDISVERAAKLALRDGRKLDIVFERSGKKEDRLLDSYFSNLKANGLEFSSENSAKYNPLTSKNFNDYLNTIRSDGKKNPMLQLADLFIHPIAFVTCGKDNRAYSKLVEHKMLLDHKHEDKAVGVKYSCYDGVYGAWQHKQKAQGATRAP